MIENTFTRVFIKIPDLIDTFSSIRGVYQFNHESFELRLKKSTLNIKIEKKSPKNLLTTEGKVQLRIEFSTWQLVVRRIFPSGWFTRIAHNLKKQLAGLDDTGSPFPGGPCCCLCHVCVFTARISNPAQWRHRKPQEWCTR